MDAYQQNNLNLKAAQLRETQLQNKALLDLTAALKASTTEQTKVRSQAVAGASGPASAAGGGALRTLVGGALTDQVGKALSSVAAGLNGLNNPLQNAAERQRNLLESIPVFGAAAKGVREFILAVNGTTAAMATLDFNVKRLGASLNAQSAANQQVSGLDLLRAEVGARASVQRNVGPFDQFNPNPGFPQVQFGGGAIDRSTLAGERAFMSAERRNPLEIEKRRAEMEAQARKQVVTDIEERIDKSASGLNPDGSQRVSPSGRKGLSIDEIQAQAGRLRAISEATTGRDSRASPEEKQRALQTEALNLVELQNRKNELLGLEQQRQAAIAQSVAAEGQVLKANVALSKEKLQTLVEQENRLRGQAQAFGQLTAAEKLGAVESLKIAKEQGIGALSEDQRAIIGRAGGAEFLAKEYENLALNDPAAQEFKNLLGETGNLRDVEQQRAKLQAEISVQVQLDEQKLATALEQQLTGVLNRIEQLFREIADISIRKTEVELRQGTGTNR